MTSETKQPGRFKAWLQLLRVPNLLTVPGDPMVGFLIIPTRWYTGELIWQDYWHLLGAVIICLLVYAAGLIHNDLCDLEEDRRERLTRPLASGVISSRAAWAVMTIMLMGSFGLAWSISGPSLLSCGCHFTSDNTARVMGVLAGLILCVLLYNHLHKKFKLLGSLVMGACRALSLVFGAVVAGLAGTGSEIFEDQLRKIIIFMLLWGGYIATVTLLASDETETKRRRLTRFLPLLSLLWITLICLYDFISACGPHIDVPKKLLVSMALLLLATAFAVRPIWALRGVSQPRDVQKQVGWLIRNLIVLQAAFIMLAAFTLLPTLWFGIGVLVLWPISMFLGKRFYAS